MKELYVNSLLSVLMIHYFVFNTLILSCESSFKLIAMWLQCIHYCFCRFPVPVDLKKTNLKKEIDKVLQSSLMSLGHGPCRYCPLFFPLEITASFMTNTFSHCNIYKLPSISLFIHKYPGCLFQISFFCLFNINKLAWMFINLHAFSLVVNVP